MRALVSMIFDSEKTSRLAALHKAAREASEREDGAVEVDVLVACASASIAARAFDRALDILVGAIILEPEHGRAWALAGIALERLRRLDEARFAYESAIALGDRDATCAMALANLYERGGELARAQALARWVATELGGREARMKALALLSVGSR